MQEHSKIEETVESIKDYANTQYELALLKGSDKLAHIGSIAFSIMPVIMLSVLTVLILSCALALYLNEKYASEYFGFLAVGLGYFFLLIIILLLRKNLIVKPLRNKIIKELFRNNNL